MGKILIGAIKSQTPTFIPSPEPLSRIAQLSSMLASASGKTSGKTSGKEAKLPDMLPGHEMAIRRQRQQIDQAEANMQAYAMKSIKDDYHGNAKAFMEGEAVKAKNGEGYYVMKENILKMDNMNKVNITAAKQDFESYKASNTDLGKNKTEGDYFYDPNGGGRVQKGVDKNNKPIFYKNQEWLQAQSANLGIGENGSLQRGMFSSTYETGALQTEIRALVKDGASDPNVQSIMGKDGNLYREQSNSNILKSNDLVNNVRGMLSKKAQTELRNEFDLAYDEFNPEEVAKLTKNIPEGEKRNALFNVFVANKINPEARLLDRYNLTRSSGKGTGSGSGGDKPMGPVASYAAGMPEQRMTRTKELSYNASGDIVWAENSDLSQMKSIDQKLVQASNTAYRNNIINNTGTKPETTGNFFYGPDGTPNNMDLFKGKKAYIYSVDGFQENRSPVPSPGLNGKKQSTTVYDIAKTGQKKGASLYTMRAKVAVHKDDIDEFLEGLRSVDTQGREKKGTFQYHAMRTGDSGIGDKVAIGDEKASKEWYLVDVELPAGDMSTYDAGTYLQNNAVNSAADNNYTESQDGENKFDQSMNITYTK